LLGASGSPDFTLLDEWSGPDQLLIP
jgi:hypothetical protein